MTAKRKPGRPKKIDDGQVKSHKLMFTNNSTSIFCVPLELLFDLTPLNDEKPEAKVKKLMSMAGKRRTLLKPGESIEIEQEAFDRIKNNSLWQKILSEGIYSVSKRVNKVYAEDRKTLSDPEVPDELKNIEESTGVKLGKNPIDILRG